MGIRGIGREKSRYENPWQAGRYRTQEKKMEHGEAEAENAGRGQTM